MSIRALHPGHGLHLGVPAAAWRSPDRHARIRRNSVAFFGLTKKLSVRMAEKATALN
jgi:hypothetical protein